MDVYARSGVSGFDLFVSQKWICQSTYVCSHYKRTGGNIFYDKQDQRRLGRQVSTSNSHRNEAKENPLFFEGRDCHDYAWKIPSTDFNMAKSSVAWSNLCSSNSVCIISNKAGLESANFPFISQDVSVSSRRVFSTQVSAPVSWNLRRRSRFSPKWFLSHPWGRTSWSYYSGELVVTRVFFRLQNSVFISKGFLASVVYFFKRFLHTLLLHGRCSDASCF